MRAQLEEGIRQLNEEYDFEQKVKAEERKKQFDEQYKKHGVHYYKEGETISWEDTVIDDERELVADVVWTWDTVNDIVTIMLDMIKGFFD